jgi:HK97 family phage prohead protease
LPGFRERILPGAFTRSLEAKQDTVCLWNHDTNKILGRVKAGTLRLAQDSRGLKYVVDLPNTQEARGFHESVSRGDVTGSSFGFQLANDDQDWDEAQDEEDRSYFVRRSIKNVTNLLDCSPVIYPAYGGTEVQARSTAVIPVELRSHVEALNRNVHRPARKHFIMPTPAECLQITLNAEARNKAEQQTVINRRRKLLNEILS